MTHEYYESKADEARLEAERATLANVRDRYLRSAAAWDRWLSGPRFDLHASVQDDPARTVPFTLARFYRIYEGTVTARPPLPYHRRSAIAELVHGQVPGCAQECDSRSGPSRNTYRTGSRNLVGQALPS
jgi:hypothetical protein